VAEDIDDTKTTETTTQEPTTTETVKDTETTENPDDTTQTFNKVDILLLKKYLLGMVRTTNANLDFNSDGNIDVLDYMLIKNILIRFSNL
jgi:hypothetical protein